MKFLSKHELISQEDPPLPQRTSYKPLTTHPEWNPPERFEFCSFQTMESNSLNSECNDEIQFTV